MKERGVTDMRVRAKEPNEPARLTGFERLNNVSMFWWVRLPNPNSLCFMIHTLVFFSQSFSIDYSVELWEIRVILGRFVQKLTWREQKKTLSERELRPGASRHRGLDRGLQGRVVRKPVNVSPGLNVNWNSMFSCFKMFFTSNVWCSWRLLQLKTEGQTI